MAQPSLSKMPLLCRSMQLSCAVATSPSSPSCRLISDMFLPRVITNSFSTPPTCRLHTLVLSGRLSARSRHYRSYRHDGSWKYGPRKSQSFASLKGKLLSRKTGYSGLNIFKELQRECRVWSRPTHTAMTWQSWAKFTQTTGRSSNATHEAFSQLTSPLIMGALFAWTKQIKKDRRWKPCEDKVATPLLLCSWSCLLSSGSSGSTGSLTRSQFWNIIVRKTGFGRK